ncbi:retrotransposon protein, putative, ty1-copia subclass [Tanacetum coccineum]
MHVIEQPLPPAPEAGAEPNIVAQWTALYDAHTKIACLMLGSMTPELHRQFELHYPYDMVQELRSMFEKQAGVEKFDLIQSFHACKQEEGKSVADYVLKMKGYVEQLERLGYILPQDISVGLILNGLLTNDFVGGFGKDKKVYIPKPNNPKPTAKERPAKDDACHHCKEVGHWKRNCPVYLAELQKKRGSKFGSCQFFGKLWVNISTSHPENKIVLQGMLNSLEASHKSSNQVELRGGAVDLEEIQEEEDTSPSEITSNIPQEVEGFEPPQSPQEEEIPIHRCYECGNTNMMDNMVWVLVDLPPGCKTVGSKWIFKKKTDMDGIVHVYKARLVAKGYTQLYGVDYEETFSPVADIRAIRILISIAAYYDYEIWQMDVKTAFLNGYLDEDIYMVQPEGFVDPNHPRKVCKLQRSIYGLKQALRSWNKRFDEKIKRFGFAQNLDDPCVYQKASGSNVTFLILYVDDIIILGNHIPSLQSVKDYLGKCFAMKDLGEAAFILGIKIYRDRSKRLIGLSQNAYIDKILKRYKMDNSKHGTIPMQERLDLNKSQGDQTPKEVNRMKNITYASAVGSIMYAVRCTRPDIAFAQNLTSRFQQNLCELHWTAVKNILKYLRNTKDMFLVYGGNPSTELRLQFIMLMNYVRECIELGEINLLKVHTDDNLADPFMKDLSKGKLTQHARSMGLHLANLIIFEGRFHVFQSLCGKSLSLILGALMILESIQSISLTGFRQIKRARISNTDVLDLPMLASFSHLPETSQSRQPRITRKMRRTLVNSLLNLMHVQHCVSHGNSERAIEVRCISCENGDKVLFEEKSMAEEGCALHHWVHDVVFNVSNHHCDSDSICIDPVSA